MPTTNDRVTNAFFFYKSAKPRYFSNRHWYRCSAVQKNENESPPLTVKNIAFPFHAINFVIGSHNYCKTKNSKLVVNELYKVALSVVPTFVRLIILETRLMEMCVNCIRLKFIRKPWIFVWYEHSDWLLLFGVIVVVYKMPPRSIWIGPGFSRSVFNLSE